MKDIHSLTKLPNIPLVGIYFLWDNNSLIYIGQSTDIHKRIYEHRKDKSFTHYSYVKSNVKSLNKLEKQYIQAYSPILNKVFNSSILSQEVEELSVKLFTAIIKENILYINVSNITLCISIISNKQNKKFVGYKGYLKPNNFNESYYGEILINKKNYFIVYDDKLKLYSITKQ